MVKQTGSLNSVAEDLFVELFCDTFGPDKSQFLFIQYPFTDIYGNRRFIDFALENESIRIAIEIDGETYHNPKKISYNKYFDDLNKQNSLVYEDWRVYRWAYNQLKRQPEKVKDELKTLALLYHATGSGKTVTAVSDAKKMGKRTLFLAHTRELVLQARRTFSELWPNISTGIYMGDSKDKDAYVV